MECLSLGGRTSKVEWKGNLLDVLYRTVSSLEFLNIVDQRIHEPLRVLGGEDKSSLDLALGSTRHNIYEIDNKFCVRVRDDGKVCVNTFGDLFRNFYVELVGLCIFHATFFTKLNICAEMHVTEIKQPLLKK